MEEDGVKEEDADGEEVEDESSEGSAAPEIGLDQHGRIAPGVRGPVDYSFRALRECVNEASCAALLRDCAAVFTARDVEEEDEAYSAGETYFVRADETPSCAIEKLALDIFEMHAQGLEYDRQKSGAEWWTLCIENSSDVAFHWDKDYGLEEHGINVFPQISTVTYLSNQGGPTCILEKTAPPLVHDSFVGPAARAFVSRPCFGKHISFDGRFLHYASADLAPLFSPRSSTLAAAGSGSGSTTTEDNQTRTTFLVNVWFNNIPRDAERLPSSVAESLVKNASFWADTRTPSSIDTIECTAKEDVVLSQSYNLFEDFQVNLNLPKFQGSADSVLVNYGPQVASCVVPSSSGM